MTDPDDNAPEMSEREALPARLYIRRARRTRGALFGVFAALFAILVWFVGLVLLNRAVFHAHPFSRQEDLAQAAILVAIALVATVAAVRWLGGAFRRKDP